MSDCIGMYRAFVESVVDDEARLRYRVRVVGMHYPTTPANNLPIAEMCSLFAAPGAGDLPHFELGDRVWVQFEHGDRNYPVIVGSWIAKRIAVEDLPTTMTADYARLRRRWTRHDRSGNSVEMSEVNEEVHVVVRSGGATVRVRMGDDGVSIEADGPVKVAGGSVAVQATVSTVEADEVVIHANGRDGSNPTGRMTLVSNKDINLHVRPTAEDGTDAGEINIGQYTDQGNPSTAGVPQKHQSPKVNVFAEEVNIGVLNDPARLDTLNVNIQAAQQVTVKASTKVLLESPGTVEITGDTEVKVLSAVKVTVDAPQIEIGL
jgi:hypothetical protein